jgi:hypothetical protein
MANPAILIQSRIFMKLKQWIFILASGLAISSPVLAQSTITLTKGQVVKIEPDGKVTVGPMDMGAKMQETMKKQAQPATKGLRVWFDQNGQLSYLSDPDAVSRTVSGAPMDKANK